MSTKVIRRFVLACALLMAVSSFGATGMTYAQDATPTVANANCPDLPDSEQQVVVVTDSVSDGIVVVREVKGKTVNVYADCLDNGETITVGKAGNNAINAWTGYPNLPYAENDACRQAQADLEDAATRGSWNEGYTVLYDGQPVPPRCGTDDQPIRSVQKDEVVPAGTVVLQEEVNFGDRTVDVTAKVLDKDTKAIFTSGYRLQFWVGYESLEAAQADVCPQAFREQRTSDLPNGWNAGFTVTVNSGQPLSGCPTS